jgi:hypothetical protein
VPLHYAAKPKVKAIATASQYSPATIASKIGTNSAYSFTDSSYSTDYGGVQQPAQGESHYYAEARYDQGAAGEYVDDKATNVAPVRNMLEINAMLNDENT